VFGHDGEDLAFGEGTELDEGAVEAEAFGALQGLGVLEDFRGDEASAEEDLRDGHGGAGDGAGVDGIQVVDDGLQTGASGVEKRNWRSEMERDWEKRSSPRISWARDCFSFWRTRIFSSMEPLMMRR